jgi:glutathione S-transferase
LPELHDHVLCDGCYTVRLMFGLCGAAYSKRTVRFVPGVTAPVYVDGTETVSGAIPILRYLAQRHDPVRWRADDHEVIHWLEIAEGSLAALSDARSVRLFGSEGDLGSLLPKARAALRTVEDRLTERHLDGSNWLVGKSLTLADIAIFAPVMLSHDAGIGHEDHPMINLWQRRVRRLEGFVTMPGIPDYF